MTDEINSTTTAAEAWRIHRAEQVQSNSVNENQTPSTPTSELERQSVEPPQVQNSPLPWHQAARAADMVIAADKARVADCFIAMGMAPSVSCANAELICKAVNSYSPDREVVTQQMYETLGIAKRDLEEMLENGFSLDRNLYVSEIIKYLTKAIAAYDQLKGK